MENSTPETDALLNAENAAKTDAEKPDENGPENLTPKPDENQAGQMTLENMTADVAKIYDGFDPTKHATNPDGTPKKRADGQWANKRGRKAGGQTVAAPTGTAQTTAPASVTAPLSAKKARESGVVTNKAAALATVRTVVYALGSTIGPEWDFADEDEQKNMLAAVEAYYDANGQVQISPEMVLAFQVFSYAAPRSQHPNTKEKLSAAWKWCKNLLKIGA